MLSAGITAGVYSLSLARTQPDLSFAGGSGARGAAELAAGWALLAVGLTSWARRPASRFGALLAVASLAWFLLEWNNPGASSVVFTTGLVLSLAAPPLVAHAVLSYPDGRLGTPALRASVATAYAASVFLLGLLPALLFDPAAAHCSDCPRNILLLRADSDLHDNLIRVGVYAGLAWSLTVIALAAWRIVRSTPAQRRSAGPVLLAGCVYVGLIAADFAHGLNRGFLSTDEIDRELWLWQSAALVVLSLSVTWTWLRARRTRVAIARLALEAANAPRPGGLADALGHKLGDDSLRITYPLAGGTRHVDAQGHPADLDGTVTPLRRGGQTIALLIHRPGLFDEPDLIDEVTAAAGLALENERLQAETSAQLEDLRQSRARIVAAADEARRRLEHNLHDGAQQRLVALSLSLRLARGSASHETAARLVQAEDELREALGALRELAHGIYPASLADEGLGAAFESLAESGSDPIDVSLGNARFDPAVEAAAYFLVAELVRRSPGRTNVRVYHVEGMLVLEADSAGEHDLPGLYDRVRALDGNLTVEVGRIRAEIPCA